MLRISRRLSQTRRVAPRRKNYTMCGRPSFPEPRGRDLSSSTVPDRDDRFGPATALPRQAVGMTAIVIAGGLFGTSPSIEVAVRPPIGGFCSVFRHASPPRPRRSPVAGRTSPRHRRPHLHRSPLRPASRGVWIVRPTHPSCPHSLPPTPRAIPIPTSAAGDVPRTPPVRLSPSSFSTWSGFCAVREQFDEFVVRSRALISVVGTPIVPHRSWCCRTLSGPFGSRMISVPDAPCFPRWWGGRTSARGGWTWDRARTTVTKSSTFATIPSRRSIRGGGAIGSQASDCSHRHRHPIRGRRRSAIPGRVVASESCSPEMRGVGTNKELN